VTAPTLTDCDPPDPDADCDIFENAFTKPELMDNDGVRAVAIYEKPNASGNHFMGVISVSGDVPTLDSEAALPFTVVRGANAGQGDHLEHMGSSVYVYGQRGVGGSSGGSTGPKFRRITGGTVVSTEARMFPASFVAAWDAATIEVFALVPISSTHVAIVYYVEDIGNTNAKIAIRIFNVGSGPREGGEVIVRTDVLGDMTDGGIYMTLVGSKLLVSWVDKPTLTKRLSTYILLS
jgi:hypothetical protein